MMTRRSVLRLAVGCGAMAFVNACSRKAQDDGTPEQQVIVREQDVEEARPEETRSGLAEMFERGEVSSVRLIGDSITAGYLCDGYGPTTDTVIYDGPYGMFLETGYDVACWANDFRAYARERGVQEFVNAGINGAKMRWLAEDPDAWVRGGADVIFVMLGTNDSVYSTAEEYAAYAEEALSAVEKSCQLMVVLSPPNNAWRDYNVLFGMGEAARVLGDLCAQHGWCFVSLYEALRLASDEFDEDQCHPSSKGSHLIWEHVATELGL